MAVVTIPSENRVLRDGAVISEFLGRYGIWYRRFEDLDRLGEDPCDQEVLAAFDEPVGRLKEEGGYVTADVINVTPSTPGLEAMLQKFNKEHTHSEDEVRFIVAGSGLFHIHPESEPVFRIEVAAGDMINVPAGTRHWFDLCSERTIRAIRLFQDPAGWTPDYTDSGEESRHEPICFGPSWLPVGRGE